MTAHIRHCSKCRRLHASARELSTSCNSILWEGGGVHVTPQQERIMCRLLLRERCTTSELIDWLHGPNPAGGPLTAENAINVQLCRIRAKLVWALAPFAIEWQPRLGYRLALRERVAA